MKIEITDNGRKAISELKTACLRALERCGSQAEGYAKDLCPVDTGELKNSIAHRVDEDKQKVYIGTDVEYAPYPELGTGAYYSGGRPTPWVYQDAKGNWHRTNGQKPQPYLKPAVADHAQTYKNIINDEMKNG